MKMGNILSPFPYDAGACHALQLVELRLPAILYFAFAVRLFTSIT
jgi:hypothetical protein